MKSKKKKLLYTPEGDLTETGEKVEKLLAKKMGAFVKAQKRKYDAYDLNILMENVVGKLIRDEYSKYLLDI